MPHIHWSRRELIKQFGLAAAFLSPILRVTRANAAVPVRKRYVGIFKPVGFVAADFWPTALNPLAANEWTNLIVQPLEAHKSHLTFIKNLEFDRPPGNAHAQGMARVFTGATVNIPPSGDAVDYGFPNDISIDQAIATHLRDSGVTTPFRSLEFGVVVRSSLLPGRMAFDAPRQALQIGTDPGVMFDRVMAKITQACGGGGGDPSLRAREISLLDATRSELTSAKTRLGLNGEERMKLERYEAAIQEIELSLQSIAPVAKPCPTGTRPAIADTPQNYAALSAAQIKILLLALDWDLTRVCTLLWSGAQSNQNFNFLTYNGAGISSQHHGLSHEMRDGIGGNAPRAKMKIIDTWYMNQLANILEGMKAIDDGDGKSLLDNSAVLMGTEVADGATHSHQNIPFILAGKAGGALKSGSLVNLPRVTSHNDLLLTVCQAMGMPITTFGEASKCHGPIAALRAP